MDREERGAARKVFKEVEKVKTQGQPHREKRSMNEEYMITDKERKRQKKMVRKREAGMTEQEKPEGRYGRKLRKDLRGREGKIEKRKNGE